MRHGPLRIGVDIGGTFTDASVVDSTGMRWSAKALTTKSNPSAGVVDCLRLIAKQLEIDLARMLGMATTFVHGSTVGTNALIERRGARTGLLMTRGHEQTITIGRVRQKVTGLSEREKIHVTHLNKAFPPIILPEDIRGVPERIDARGDILVDLDVGGASRAIDELVESGVESLAVCFLWSFLNRTHEAKVRDIIRARHPQYLRIDLVGDRAENWRI